MKKEELKIIFENSSNLNEASYDVFMNVLSITFKNGTRYDFLGVEKELFEEFKSATSAGRFFHSKIKGKYDFFKNKILNEDCKK